MSRKLLFLTSLIVVLGLVGNCWADGVTYNWTDANDIKMADTDGDWMDPCNWWPIPGSMPHGKDTLITIGYDHYATGGVHPILDEDVGSVGIMKIGSYLNATGISKLLVRSGALLWVEHDATISSSGDFLTGSTTGAPGTLIMTGGSLGFDDQYQIGKRAAGVAHLVYDDVNDASGYPVLYGDHDDGYIKFGGSNYGTGDASMVLDYGLLHVGGMSIYTNEGYINITGGTMEIGGERSNDYDTMEDYILAKAANDEVECYLGDGEMSTLDDTPESGFVTVWCDPRPVNCPGEASPKKHTLADMLQLDKLIWDSGANADVHKVYLDTARSEVNEMNAPALVYTSAVDGPNEYSLQTGDLVIGETHYWRVVEINDSNVVCEGYIWLFYIDECVAIDSFESYASASFPSPDSLWIDDPDGEAIIDLQEGNTYYDNTTDGGSKSMHIDYAEENGDDNYGTVRLEPANGGPQEDFTVGGSAEAVAFWYAAPTEAQKISIEIDGAGPYDVNAVLDGCWHEATVALTDLGGGPSDVDAFDILIGDGVYDALTAGYDIYIDDLTVCKARCVPEWANIADLDDDCDVDNYDAQEMWRYDWLIYDENRGAYDGNTGGATTGDNTVSFGYNAARDMNVAIFDGNNDFIEMPGAAFANFNDKTQALWVYYDTTVAADVDVNGGAPVQMGTAFNRGYIQMNLSGDPAYDEDTIAYRKGYGVMTAEETGTSSLFRDKWIHVAAVTRNDCEGQQIELYVDGTLRDTDIVPLHVDNREYATGDEEALGGNPSGDAGTGRDGHFAGMIADYRVYSVALTAGQINDIYTGSPTSSNLWLHYTFDSLDASDVSGATHYHAIVSQADLDDSESQGDKIIGWLDHEVFCDNWGASYSFP